MKRVCYFCCNDMGLKDNGLQGAIFYSICDKCYGTLKIDERLPELLWAIADLRRKNGSIKQSQTANALVVG